MRIGLTYNSPNNYAEQGFTLEESSGIIPHETLISISSAIQSLNYQPILIGNFINLIQKIEAGERWDLVFNLAEGNFGSGREALVPAILDAYRIPYTFSEPFVLSICTHKVMAKRLVKENGVKTAAFHLIENIKDIEYCSLPFPVFIKPVLGGRSLGINQNSYIENETILKKNVLDLLETYRQPVLIESYLAGREFTVGIAGKGEEAKAIGILELKLNQQADPYAYTRANKIGAINRLTYALPTDTEAISAEEQALKAWRALNCRGVGRIDMRSDQYQTPHFIEANPIPGLHPEYSDLVILSRLKHLTYVDLIEIIIKESLNN